MVRSILLVCVQLNEGTSKRTGAILKLEIRHCRRSRFSFSPFLLLPPSSSRPALVPVHPLPPPVSLSPSCSPPFSVFLPPFIEHREEAAEGEGEDTLGRR